MDYYSLYSLYSKNYKKVKTSKILGVHMHLNENHPSFCEECSDWIRPEGWQEDGRYFCPTCLKFIKVDLMWRT
jgi:formamidopyrimidine-DNA glycosylase